MTPTLRALWEEQPTDPDLEADLGYPFEPLMMIEGSEHGDQLIFLPAEEQQLLDDEFIVADSSAVAKLSEWR